MAWRDFGSRLIITRRRRIVASALIYGLSLSVRFTSATGEEVEAPTPPALGTNPLTSVMINGGAQIFTRTWPARFGQPAILHHGCRAACGNAMPAPFMPDCAEYP